jgi:hypothetical protein
METKVLALLRFPFFTYEEIAPWLTFSVTPQQVEDFLGHLGIYPQILPTKVWHLMLMQASWKVKMRKEKSGRVKEDKLFIPKELLGISRSLAEAVSIFLDGQEPEGISEIYIKKDSLDILLATILAFEGEITVGKKEKIGQIQLDFGLREKQEINVLSDEVILIPQGGAGIVKLKVKTFGKAKITGRKQISFEAQGGRVGIVIDSRGRPMFPPTLDEEGRRRLLGWQEGFLREF